MNSSEIQVVLVVQEDHDVLFSRRLLFSNEVLAKTFSIVFTTCDEFSTNPFLCVPKIGFYNEKHTVFAKHILFFKHVSFNSRESRHLLKIPIF